MPVELGEIVKFMRNLGYEVKRAKTKSVVDKLLGAFEGAVEEKTSTEYLKELRKSGYGKY